MQVSLNGSNVEVQRFLNVQAPAGSTLELTVTKDVPHFTKFYVISKSNVSHEWGVRAKRKISGSNTFGVDIDTIDVIMPITRVNCISDPVEHRCHQLAILIDNNDTSARNYDVIVMGVA